MEHFKPFSVSPDTYFACAGASLIMGPVRLPARVSVLLCVTMNSAQTFRTIPLRLRRLEQCTFVGKLANHAHYLEIHSMKAREESDLQLKGKLCLPGF